MNILVAGHDRSGTSWVGKTLAQYSGVEYHYEPTNPQINKGIVEAGFDLWNRIQASERHHQVFDPIFNVKDGINLVKETGSMMLLDWFYKEYKTKIILVLANPYHVVMENINMAQHNAYQWFTQLMMEGLPLHQHLSDLPRNPTTVFAIVYCMRYQRAFSKLPKDGYVLYWDHLCFDPLKEYGNLFDWLGWVLTPEMIGYITKNTTKTDSHFFGTSRVSADEPYRWKDELSDRQKDNINKVLERFNFRYHQDIYNIKGTAHA